MSLQILGWATADFLGRESWAVRKTRPFYELALHVAHRGRGIPWTINDLCCRIDPRHRCRMSKRYECPVSDFLRSRVHPGQVCYDVGANVGVYVLQFAGWGASVVAFEPNRDSRKVLRSHVRMNGFTQCVKIEPYAVGAQTGRAAFYQSGQDGMSRLAAANPLLGSSVVPVAVEVISLDKYIEGGASTPDILLIDIEGLEFQALAGAEKLITRNRDLVIVCEMHPGSWGLGGFDRQTAERLLVELRLIPVGLENQSDPMDEHGLVWLKPY